MARFYRHRDTRLPSLFVPLPVDYMRQQVQQVQRAKDMAVSEAAGMEPLDIKAIEWADKDIAARDAYNKQFSDISDQTVEMGMNIDKNNPMRTINAMTSNVMKMKSMKKSITKQGTDAYQVNKNFQEWEQFKKDVAKDNTLSQREKLGKIQRYKEAYAERGFYRQGESFNPFGEFSQIQDVDYVNEAHKRMSSIKPYKTGSLITTNPGGEWLVTEGSTQEMVGVGQVINAGFASLTSPESRARIEELIENNAATITDPTQREEYRRRELSALYSAGKTPEHDSTLTEEKKKNPVNRLDGTTIVGKQLLAGVDAYSYDNTTYKHLLRSNPTWDYGTGASKASDRSYVTSLGSLYGTHETGADVIQRSNDLFTSTKNAKTAIDNNLKKGKYTKNSPEYERDYNAYIRDLREYKYLKGKIKSTMKDQGLDSESAIERINSISNVSTDISNDKLKNNLQHNPEWVIQEANQAIIRLNNKYGRTSRSRHDKGVYSDNDWMRLQKYETMLKEANAIKKGIADTSFDISRGTTLFTGDTNTVIGKQSKQLEKHLENSTDLMDTDNQNIRYNPKTDTQILTLDSYSGEISIQITKNADKGDDASVHLVSLQGVSPGKQKSWANSLRRDTYAGYDAGTLSAEEAKNQLEIANNMEVTEDYGRYLDTHSPIETNKGDRYKVRRKGTNEFLEFENIGAQAFKIVNPATGKVVDAPIEYAGVGGIKQAIYQQFYTQKPNE